MEVQNIELRSEKVRNIIGKMPSVLIRYGIGMIATIITLIVVGSFFFHFTPTYNTTAQVCINDTDTIIRIDIPCHLKQEINVGNYSVISFDNFSENNLSVIIESIDLKTFINNSGTYNLAYCKITDLDINIETEGFVFANADIFGYEISMFDYIIKKFFRKR